MLSISTYLLIVYKYKYVCKSSSLSRTLSFYLDEMDVFPYLLLLLPARVAQQTQW